MRIRAGLIFLLLLTTAPIARAQDSYCNPLDILIADPFVLQHDGVYYLYGTLRARDGFDCWTSKDLVHWRLRGPVYQRADGQWPRTMFWASECFEHKGKFYLHGSAIGDQEDRHRLILAQGDTPLGPFKLIAAPWGDLGKTVIDGDVFKNTDGKLYLYYVLDARQNPHGSEIYVRKLNDDLLTFDGEAVRCASPGEQHWEGTLINEGPFVLKHGDTYYLMYSANGATDPWYAVGYATASSPMGPWTKFKGNPILRKTDKVSGPGHHSVVPSPDGKELFIVYHTHQQPARPWWSRQLAIDRLTFVENSEGSPAKMVVKGPTATTQPMPSGSPAIERGKSDEFDEKDLDRGRWTIFNERPDHWRLEDGSLVIQTQEGEVKEMRADLRNLFLTTPPRGDFAVSTHVRFHAEQDLEQAFICLWQNHNNFVRLSAIHDGKTKFQIASEHDAKYEASTFDNTIGDDLYLRLERRNGSVAFKISSNGQVWQPLGDPIKIDLLDPRVGLGADSAQSRRDVPARFDFLHFEP
jgi:beta-xylosidase